MTYFHHFFQTIAGVLINNNVKIETPQHSEAVHNFNRINELNLIHWTSQPCHFSESCNLQQIQDKVTKSSSQNADYSTKLIGSSMLSTIITFERKSFLDSLVAGLTKNNIADYTDDDIAFALYKDFVTGWGFFDHPKVSRKKEIICWHKIN